MKGKIYSIRNYIDTDIYVGSTYQALSKRMTDHRRSINNTRDKHMLLYCKMREFGVENFYIELLEEYECENKEQLRAKEGEYIRTMGSLNRRIEGRTIKEWRDDNKDHLKEQKQKYYQANKESLLSKSKEYVSQNKQKTVEYQTQYRELHKEGAQEYKRNWFQEHKDTLLQKCLCECGKYYTACHKRRHERTKQHIEFVSSQETLY